MFSSVSSELGEVRPLQKMICNQFQYVFVNFHRGGGSETVTENDLQPVYVFLSLCEVGEVRL